MYALVGRGQAKQMSSYWHGFLEILGRVLCYTKADQQASGTLEIVSLATGARDM